jgi:PAS domain S-box-containing protein
MATQPADKGLEFTQQALRASEERFRLLVEGVRDYAILMLDPDGRVISWNAGAQLIKGYTADEIIGQHFSVFYPEEAIARKWYEEELELARIYGRFEDEGWRLRKGGERFWANVIITAMRDETGVLQGYSKVTRDLTVRKRVEALEAARERINQFLAMLAHELRNPLAPIRNAVSVMRLQPAANPQLSWCRDVIDRQVTHLSRLVDDLLDVSRITSGKITLDREPLQIALLLSRALEGSSPLIEARSQTINLRMHEPALWVNGDMTRLSQVLLNLLNNAAKYTQEGGHIVVTVSREDECAVVRVSDNGVGMAAELVPRVFDLFMQGDATLDRADGGLGIGLTLVREIVAMHGGSVEAASPGLNQGSEFTVRLPVYEPQPHAGEEPEGGRAGAVSARRVLVVDDNRDSADSMGILLRSQGHEVQVAYDGPDALVKAAAFKPHVAMLDIGLPGMDGYQLAQNLRAAPGGRELVLIAATGYGQEEDKSLSLVAGFDHHLVKPVSLQAIEEIMEGLGISAS